MGVKPGNTNLALSAGRLIILMLTLLLSHPLLAQQASVRSELSASTITRDESVSLTVTAVGVEGELDTSALNKDFDIVGQSSSRQIRTVINGSNQPVTMSIVTWTLELLPRDVGVFTVPAVSVGGVSSQLQSLTVNEIPTGVRRDVFVETSVDSRKPWVQSQVLMTVRVFQAIEIVDGGLSDPAGDQLQVQRIGKDSSSIEVRDGREYRITERRFALFPQKSGPVTINPVVLSVSVPTNATATLGLFSPTRKLTRRSDPITLDVQARPSSGAAWWLPASALQIDSNWADDASKAVVDQPLTRTITLRAGGVMDSQLPDIPIPAIEGVSLYAEEPVRAMGMNERGLVAEQTIKWALIPQREGQLVLPELSIEWFNTDTGETETAVLPEERIQVGPSTAVTASQAAPVVNAADGNGPPAGDTEVGAPDASDSLTAQETPTAVANLDVPDRDPSIAAPDNTVQAEAVGDAGRTATEVGTGSPMIASESSDKDASALPGELAGEQAFRPWRLAALLLLGLWLLSLALFWWWRRRLLDAHRGESAGVSGQLSSIRQHARKTYQKLAPLAEVETCCKADDPAALGSALIAWAARQWPQQAPRTLTDIALRLNEGPARESVQALDAALYSRGLNQQDRDELMNRMRQLPVELPAAMRGEQSGAADAQGHLVVDGRRQGNGLPAL